MNTDDLRHLIGPRMRKLREQANRPQAHVADLLDVAQGTVSKWERGETLPPLDQLIRFCDVIGVHVMDVLAVAVDYPHPQDPRVRELARLLLEEGGDE